VLISGIMMAEMANNSWSQLLTSSRQRGAAGECQHESVFQQNEQSCSESPLCTVSCLTLGQCENAMGAGRPAPHAVPAPPNWVAIPEFNHAFPPTSVSWSSPPTSRLCGCIAEKVVGCNAARRRFCFSAHVPVLRPHYPAPWDILPGVRQIAQTSLKLNPDLASAFVSNR
jgi:hypothetical protein